MEASGGRAEPGKAEAGAPPPPTLTVAAVARRLGVAPPTLRTWDRRYGLGPSAHTAGAHRRYSPSDVARLMVMRRLTLQGVPPADAARFALAAQGAAADGALASITPIGERSGIVELDDFPGAAALPELPDLPELPGLPGPPELPEPRGTTDRVADERPDPSDGGELADLDGGLETLESEDVDDPFSESDLRAARFANQADPSAADLYEGPWRDEPGREIETPWLGVLRSATGGRASPGGGRVVALPDGSPQARGLARAAMSLDTHQVARLVREAMRREGVVKVWDDMVVPVLRALGERTAATGDGIDVEHAFSEAMLGVLRGVAHGVREPRNPSPVLLACADGDYHSMPLHVLAAALAERDVSCRMLGTGLPPHALAAAVRRTGPCAVVLYAQNPGADAAGTEELRRQRPAPRIVLGGPGWLQQTVPTGVRSVLSLGEGIDEVLLAVHA